MPLKLNMSIIIIKIACLLHINFVKIIGLLNQFILLRNHLNSRCQLATFFVITFLVGDFMETYWSAWFKPCFPLYVISFVILNDGVSCSRYCVPPVEFSVVMFMGHVRHCVTFFVIEFLETFFPVHHHVCGFA